MLILALIGYVHDEVPNNNLTLLTLNQALGPDSLGLSTGDGSCRQGRGGSVHQIQRYFMARYYLNMCECVFVYLQPYMVLRENCPNKGCTITT